MPKAKRRFKPLDEAEDRRRPPRPGAASERPAPDGRNDPISAAVGRGIGKGQALDLEPPPWALTKARQDLARARAARSAEPALSHVLALIELYPESEVLQIVAARIVEATMGPALATLAWSNIVARFPTSLDAFRTSIRNLVRTRGHTAALHDVRAIPFEAGGLLSDGLRKMAAFEELSEVEAADGVFARLAALFAAAEPIHVERCRALLARNLHVRALNALNEAVERFPQNEWFQTQRRDVNLLLADFELVAPGVISREGSLSCLVLEDLLDRAAEERAGPPSRPKPYLGPTVLVTGTLGLGGAERQIATSAIALQRAASTGGRIAGRPVLGPITICARDLNPAKGHSFFLENLRAEGVDVVQYLSFPKAGGDPRASLTTPYRNVLKFLPERMTEGVLRLVDWLVWQRPDVVHIWQDGMVYATALAAVMAGVPRIVLSLRTLPSIDRRDRHKAEHRTLYSKLAALPGVTFTTNSLIAAGRFESWLGLAEGSVVTIPNGVALARKEPSQATRDLAGDFFRRTADATLTLGGVMRLDENKRPLEWADVAIAFLAAVPTARFVVVGGGPLLAPMRDYVERRGLAQRFLFVGPSQDVPFWLTQMDIFLALSRFEGLPNATIEAQLAGLPVIATPAGGTREALEPDVTGLLLSNAETVGVDEVVAKLVHLATNPDVLRAMSESARRWAERTFSIDSMIERTVETFFQDAAPSGRRTA